MSATDAQQPRYPPIQFPEGVDISDLYGLLRVSMCMAHVPPTPLSPSGRAAQELTRRIG